MSEDKIFNVGPDNLYDFDEEEGFDWIVYTYTASEYDGTGEVIALRSETKELWCQNLSHCSCFGPFEGQWTECDKISIQDFLKKRSVYDFEYAPELEKKVRELLLGAK